MRRAAALLLLALVPAAPPPAAASGWLASPDLVRLFAGEVVAGHATLPGGRVVPFREHFAPGGSFAGVAGPPDDPARWSWHGRWWVEDGCLCRSVPALNSRNCMRITSGMVGYRATAPTGKLGSPASATVADLTGHGVPLAGWRVPALVLRASTLTPTP